MITLVEPGLYRHWKGNHYRVLFLARFVGQKKLEPDADVTVFVSADGMKLLAKASDEVNRKLVTPILEAKNSTDGPMQLGESLVVYVSLYGEGRVSVRTVEEFVGSAPSGEPCFARPVELPPLGSSVVVKYAGRLRGLDPDGPGRMVKEGDLVALVRTRDGRAVIQVNGQPEVKTCMACAFCGMGPDDDYPVCGHPDAGSFGLYIKKEPLEHCPDFVKFQQHPNRGPDGSLKSLSIAP